MSFALPSELPRVRLQSRPARPGRSLAIAAILAVLIAGVPAGPIIVPASASSTSEQAESARLLREGRYVLSYFGRKLAEETFSIHRTSRGYRIHARFTPDSGDQVASESTYELDEQRRLITATFTPLEGDGPSAMYRIEGTTLIAEASSGETQRIELQPGDLVAGPHYVTDFFILHPLDYQVDQQGRHVCHTFGFQDWRVQRCIVESERISNSSIDHPDGGDVETIVYRCHIQAGKKNYRTRSFLDSDGVAIRLKIGAPIGSATISLKPIDGE